MDAAEAIETVARAICRANLGSIALASGKPTPSVSLDAEVDRLWRDDIPGAIAAMNALSKIALAESVSDRHTQCEDGRSPAEAEGCQSGPEGATPESPSGAQEE